MNIKLHNRKGFTIIELAIVLSALLIIIGLSSGVYFGIVKKSQDAGIIKMATDDLPKAIMSFYLDTGAMPEDNNVTIGEGSHTGLLALVKRSAVKGDGNNLTAAKAQARWKGPYLKTGLDFNSWGQLIDPNQAGVTYSWISQDGVVGQFGRTASGGRDYCIQVGGVDQETAEGITAKLGSHRVMCSQLNDWHYDCKFIFYQVTGQTILPIAP
jgi:prepilin-type N-terminal cleavage/methylation domain-containing protein